jgi:predicted RNase H-like HicB family nuclease
LRNYILAAEERRYTQQKNEIIVPAAFSRDPGVYAVYTEAGRAEVSRYTVFIEATAAGYSAHVPDLPGYVAAASTLGDTRNLIEEAVEFHIETIRSNGDEVPEPTRHVEQD